MDYLVTTSEGFDNVTFGEKRASVREKIGGYESFRKSETSKKTTDDFGDFHAYYTPDDELEAVEFFEGGLLVKDKYLKIGIPAANFKMIFSELCKDITVVDGMIESRSLNFRACEEDDIVTSVLFHRPGYYDL